MNASMIEDIRAAIQDRLEPSVTLWNRLESRPRAVDFTRALRAEVCDGLWFLTRQWQTGELQGDDAGTPVFAKVHLSTSRLTKYRAAGGPAESFDDTMPLETKVERRPIRFFERGQPVAFDLRLLMGRQWLKLVKPIGAYAAEFIREYAIDPPEPAQVSDARYCAHREVWASLAAVAGRRMDGAKLYFYLTGNASHHAYDRLTVAASHRQPLDQAAANFVKWFNALFVQPPAGRDDAWEADRLEYQFGVSAPAAQGETVFAAQEYYHGHLDWYNVDRDTAATTLGATIPQPPSVIGGETRTLIPTPVSFTGMPNTRWWAFEDGKTNFGDVKPNTTDIAKVLLIEFGLVYANDWFLIPFTLPMGSIAHVAGLAVTNVFGERTWIEPAGTGTANDWQRWNMFGVSAVSPTAAPDSSILLLPTPPKVQEGRLLEEIMLARDEMANMVWAIEQRVPLATGDSKPGAEAATELLSHLRRIHEGASSTTPPATPIDYNASIRYELMNSVPEQWIPFISVHVPGDPRAMQLQRAAMPRVLDELTPASSTPEKVEPRTSLLRHGLDQTNPRSYFIHEEEVPRAGVRVTQGYQRTRWTNGRVFVWLGARKLTGRGEGSSGLAFDRIVDVPPQ